MDFPQFPKKNPIVFFQISKKAVSCKKNKKGRYFGSWLYFSFLFFLKWQHLHSFCYYCLKEGDGAVLFFFAKFASPLFALLSYLSPHRAVATIRGKTSTSLVPSRRGFHCCYYFAESENFVSLMFSSSLFFFYIRCGFSRLGTPHFKSSLSRYKFSLVLLPIIASV